MSEGGLFGTKLFGRPSKRYPDASSCIGTRVGHFHARDWWHATGTARAQFKAVELDILNQLQTGFTDCYYSIVHFHLYMIGRCTESAIPTIMFFCEDKEPRKKAKKIIDEGGLLARLPGFRTGHQTRRPDVGTLVQPAVEDSIVPKTADTPHLAVFYDKFQPVRSNGMSIFVHHSHDTYRRATAYAVSKEGTCFLMTVSHVFSNEPAEMSATREGDGDSDYDLGSDTDIDDEDHEQMEIMSRASASSHGIVSDYSPLSTFSDTGSSEILSYMDATDIDHEGAKPAPSTPPPPTTTANDRFDVENSGLAENVPNRLSILGIMLESSNDQDWALITITNNLILQTLKWELECREHYPAAIHTTTGKIVLRTAHRQSGITGYMSPDITYMRLPRSLSFQALYEVILDSALDQGDCGALAFSEQSRTLYGHIVASSENRLIAFIMPAYSFWTKSQVCWSVSAPAEPSTSKSGKRSNTLVPKILLE